METYYVIVRVTGGLRSVTVRARNIDNAWKVAHLRGFKGREIAGITTCPDHPEVS